MVVNVSMTRYPRKSSRFFKFLKFQNIKNVTVECDYCNYAGFGNDYRYIGTVDDLFEHFWSFWVRCGASMSTFPLDFYIVKSNFFQTYKITVKNFFFWKSNNGFPLMVLNLTYMWNIVAKLAKLQKSIFSRGTPTATTTTTIIYHYSLIQYIAIYCNSIVATSPPHTYCNTFLVPPINTILLQYLLQYIAIQYIVPYLWH